MDVDEELRKRFEESVDGKEDYRIIKEEGMRRVRNRKLIRAAKIAFWCSLPCLFLWTLLQRLGLI